MHFVYDSPQALRVAISLLRDHRLGCNGANDNPERMIILTVHLAWTRKPPDLLGAQCLIRFANSPQTESKRILQYPPAFLSRKVRDIRSSRGTSPLEVRRTWRAYWIGNCVMVIETIIQHDWSFQRRLSMSFVAGIPNSS